MDGELPGRQPTYVLCILLNDESQQSKQGSMKPKSYSSDQNHQGFFYRSDNNGFTLFSHFFSKSAPYSKLRQFVKGL